MFRSELGSLRVLSFPTGLRFLVRLFSATPPAIPASAAPPATSGVFAFEARFPTFLPVFATGPLVVVRRCACFARDVPFPLRELPDDLVRDDFDEPLRLVDRFELERLRVDRLLEDRVVWAICCPPLWLPCRLRRSRRPCPLGYPSRRCLNR